MAVYDGFFDAVMDDETGEYDRAYSSGDFAGYFANVIGTGVCIHDNPDSFKVRLEGERAVVSPGYLFIRGYWLKNDADYPIDIPSMGNYAIAAHLNLGKRMIELEARSVAQAYPDSLVLAIVSPVAAEDTRRNTDICGIIDTAGELSKKVEWAVNYIDTEIESRLDQVEQDINAQAAKLDAKIAEVQAVADSIVPPPVGSIKFSASQDVGEEWLRCDGSFVNEADYPELVAVLGKLIPSGDKFQLISSGEIGPQISNGVVYGGRMWVYSHSTKKLYGVDLAGMEAIKEIQITSEDENFTKAHTPSKQQPIALSVVETGGSALFFLSQILYNGTVKDIDAIDALWVYTGSLLDAQNDVRVTQAFFRISGSAIIDGSGCVPYVSAQNGGGGEKYIMMVSLKQSISWASGSEFATASTVLNEPSRGAAFFTGCQRAAYSPKNHGEAVLIGAGSNYSNITGTSYYSEVVSSPGGAYSRDAYFTAKEPDTAESISVADQINIAGNEKILFGASKSAVMSIAINALGHPKLVHTDIHAPSSARTFADGGAYLWGKDIYMIFVGTGIIFSRSLEEGSFGYLDTTSVLGTITQFGYLDYSQDEGTLYLLGQDTTNTVKVGKIVLNTLYDYANDGTWLPLVAADGVPAYIKASNGGGPGGAPITITVLQPSENFDRCADVIFNGEILIAGTYTRNVPIGGFFSVGYRVHTTLGAYNLSVRLNGATATSGSSNVTVGTEKTALFNVSDYASAGIALQGL